MKDIIEKRLKELRVELAATQQRHESLMRQMQASQIAGHQVTGAITELETLKRLLVGERNGEGLPRSRAQVKKVNGR